MSNGRFKNVTAFSTPAEVAHTDAAAEELVELRGQLDAINRVQAVIEFDLDGTVVTANDNFLTALGYNLSEIAGKHHSLFVDAAYRESPETRQFWRDLHGRTRPDRRVQADRQGWARSVDRRHLQPHSGRRQSPTGEGHQVRL